MGPDDGDDDDVGHVGPPLPPDDRLWRHPSELGDRPPSGRRTRTAVPVPARSAAWPVAVAAGLAGAALATGVIVLTGTLSPRVVERSVVEKVAVTPIVSSPMLRGMPGVAEVAEQLRPAIVRVDVERRDGNAARGSGIVFRDDGLVLTSASLLPEAREVTVVLADGRRLEATVVGRDPLTDVAVLDADAEHLPVAVLGSAATLQVGAATITIGAPTGAGGRLTVLAGIVSALGRQVPTSRGLVLHGMIQTDTPLEDDAAGGAVVDATGAVVGLTTAGAEDGDRFGYATPVDVANRVADRIVTHGRMVHGWLGVEGIDLPGELASTLGVPGGALVREVAPGSPAAAAGLAPNDVVTAIGDDEVRSISTLIVALRQHDPGDQVTVAYWRAGAPHEATVTIAERPPG